MENQEVRGIRGVLGKSLITETIDNMIRQSSDTLERMAILAQRLSGVLRPEIAPPEESKKPPREQKSLLNMAIEDEIKIVIAIGGIVENILARLEI